MREGCLFLPYGVGQDIPTILPHIILKMLNKKYVTNLVNGISSSSKVKELLDENIGCDGNPDT